MKRRWNGNYLHLVSLFVLTLCRASMQLNMEDCQLGWTLLDTDNSLSLVLLDMILKYVLDVKVQNSKIEKPQSEKSIHIAPFPWCFCLSWIIHWYLFLIWSFRIFCCALCVCVLNINITYFLCLAFIPLIVLHRVFSICRITNLPSPFFTGTWYFLVWIFIEFNRLAINRH